MEDLFGCHDIRKQFTSNVFILLPGSERWRRLKTF